jgi:hypothetical protein
MLNWSNGRAKYLAQLSRVFNESLFLIWAKGSKHTCHRYSDAGQNSLLQESGLCDHFPAAFMVTACIALQAL